MLTYIIITQMCLLIVSLLLKTAFWPWRQKIILAVVYAIIILLMSGTLFDLSRTTVDTLVGNRAQRLDWSILVTLEAIIMIAYCFTEGTWHKILSLYPGLLAIAAIYYLQMQVLFSHPSINYKMFGWWSALAVAVFIIGGSILVKKGTGHRDACHELLFITNLMLVILCIIFSGII